MQLPEFDESTRMRLALPPERYGREQVTSISGQSNHALEMMHLLTYPKVRPEIDSAVGATTSDIVVLDGRMIRQVEERGGI